MAGPPHSSGGITIETIERLEALSNAIGVPGFEREVRVLLESWVRPLVDELETDRTGNLIATRRGKRDTKLMLDAHMDEVGFMVSYIEAGGYLRLIPLGGWDVRIIPSHAVTIVADDGSRIRGVIGTPPPHILTAAEREKPYPLEDLFVDIGAADRMAVEARGVRIGSPAAIAYPFDRLTDEIVVGKALDDRVGCALLVETLDALADEEPELTVVANFAVGEEVGLRGARTAAYSIEPDLALALEGTVAADVPGIPEAKQLTRMGGGPAITVADRSLIVDPRLVEFLSETAESLGIPFQLKLPGAGGTDAGAIQQSRGGTTAGVISVPCRYIHSPLSLMKLTDFGHAVQLVKAFVGRAPEFLDSV